MDAHGWPSEFQRDGESIDGTLIHEPSGLADAVTLDAPPVAATGSWPRCARKARHRARIIGRRAREFGKALGNRDVVTRYNLRGVIEGARQVTKLTRARLSP